jgi:hypothetical protein
VVVLVLVVPGLVVAALASVGLVPVAATFVVADGAGGGVLPVSWLEDPHADRPAASSIAAAGPTSVPVALRRTRRIAVIEYL